MTLANRPTFRFSPRPRGKASLAPWMTTLAIAGTLCLSAACSKEPGEKEPTVAVQAVAAETTTLHQTVTAQAVLFPLQQAAITPKISAPVRKFLVNRGSKVHQGQLLAILENRDLQAASEENKGGLEKGRAATEP